MYRVRDEDERILHCDEAGVRMAPPQRRVHSFRKVDARPSRHPRLCYPPTGWNRPEQYQQENANRPSRVPAKRRPGMRREAL